MFTACHPRLAREARAALALRMVCGLTTAEIARAFLLPEATIGQRILRAKRTLTESGLTYETPRGEALSERLASVLEVVYLIFNEGFTAARGDDWMRPQLCNEALRLARVLIAVAPQEAEAHGLLALMELNASRANARVDAKGDPILCSTRTVAAGTSCRSAAAFAPWPAPTSSTRSAAPTPCRPPSPPATPRRKRRRTRTGRSSRRSMGGWRRSCPRRSSS